MAAVRVAVMVGLIWAQSTGGVIGAAGTLPWHLPEDLAHFRTVTHGQVVVMGRRTWRSLPDRFRPLPGRRNLVLSRHPERPAPGAEVIGSADDLLTAIGEATAGEATAGEVTVWVIGGAEVFRATQHLATVAEVTEVDIEVAGDTYAPPLAGWTRLSATPWLVSGTGLRYRHLRYVRDPGPVRRNPQEWAGT